MAATDETRGDVLPGPLEGLRVVEIGDLGEVAGKLLADAGADVIRVEPPGGGRSRRVGPFVDDDPGQASLLHATRNTSKRAVTLDVTQPAGLELWRRLVGLVDVVIDATTPTLLDELGGAGSGRRLSRSCGTASGAALLRLGGLGLGGTGRRTTWFNWRSVGR